uniref:hypothetical protein n=1 Tax=Trichocoleus desertorum TaxID=1481672 RepID=UPI0025B37AE7|nr:hypothetical protein [Trichocoleus desertorum]
MTQQNILEQAKQGNAQAIATLMNRSLTPKGITAKAALKGKCLQVMLEGAQVPGQEMSVNFIRSGITKLGCEAIESIKIFGRQTGEEFPAWTESIELHDSPFNANDFNEKPPTQQPPVKAVPVAVGKNFKPCKSCGQMLKPNTLICSYCGCKKPIKMASPLKTVVGIFLGISLASAIIASFMESDAAGGLFAVAIFWGLLFGLLSVDSFFG